MSLIIATGSNLGDKKANLRNAKKYLSYFFDFVAESKIYQSEPVDYLDQPVFFNQVLEFKTPSFSPEKVMSQLLEVEKLMGRKRDIPKGPRIIDLDLIFYGDEEIRSSNITIPHPRWDKREFVYVPMKELPFFPGSQAAKTNFPPAHQLIRV